MPYPSNPSPARVALLPPTWARTGCPPMPGATGTESGEIPDDSLRVRELERFPLLAGVGIGTTPAAPTPSAADVRAAALALVAADFAAVPTPRHARARAPTSAVAAPVAAAMPLTAPAVLLAAPVTASNAEVPAAL